MSGYHRSSNDTHYFLGIVEPVADAEQCRRYKLQFLEPVLGSMRVHTPADMKNQQSKPESNHHPDKRSKENKRDDFQDDTGLYGTETVSHDGSTGKSPDKSMRR